MAPKTSKIVLYHAEWCRHCKTFLPTWNKLKKKLDEIGVEHNEFEDGVDTKEIEQASIKGFPTLLVHRNGTVEEYEGRRTEEDIMKYLEPGQNDTQSQDGGNETTIGNGTYNTIEYAHCGGGRNDSSEYGHCEVKLSKNFSQGTRRCKCYIIGEQSGGRRGVMNGRKINYHQNGGGFDKLKQYQKDSVKKSSRKQTGGAKADYYKLKYLKYKTKYLETKS